MTDLPGAGGLIGGAGTLVGGALDTVGAVAGPVVEHVAGTGETLAGLAEQVGAPVSAVVEANPHLAGLDLLPAGARVTLPLSTAAPAPPPAPTSPAPGEAGSALPGAATGPQPSSAGADWRVMAQAAPPPTPPSPNASAAAQPAGSLTAPNGAPPLGGLAAVAPDVVERAAAALPELSASLALLAAGALMRPAGVLPPELQAPTPLTLAAALSRVGWTPVAAEAVRPGDVVIVLTAEGLRAVRVPADGAALLLQLMADEDAPPLALRSPLEAAALVRAPNVQPPGFDAAAPVPRRERERGRSGGRDRRSSDAPDPRRAWIERVLPVAKWIKAKWGVPVAVTVAHGALVSDWGRIAPENDFFGLLKLRRAGTATTPVRNAGRDGAPAYANLDAAADDYGAFLSGRRRSVSGRDVQGTVRELAEAGAWGGETRFAERLNCLIALNGLDAFDAA